MPPRLTHYLWIILVAGVVMFTNLGGARLWDRDEPRNAGCAAEMMARGDLVVPVFNAEQRTHKPVLLYWLMIVSYQALGISEFAARLPSALLAIGTSLCTYEMGRRLFSPRVGLWSAMILPTSLMFVIAGRAATPDSTLIFFSTLAITAFVVGAFPANPGTREAIVVGPIRWKNWAAMYAATGLAVLAKGPVGFLLPTAVVGMFLLIKRREVRAGSEEAMSLQGRLLGILKPFEPRHFLRTCWSMRPITAIAVCLAIAAPWYVWVGIKTDGEFLRGFFLEHNVGRAMQSMEGHRGNLLFYPAAILAGFFPWSVFAAPLLIDAMSRYRKRHSWNPGYVFIACWVGVYVGLFSLARTKLPSYVTPCYPALALAAGSFVDRWLAGDCHASRRWLYAAFAVFGAVGTAFVIALPIAIESVLPGEGWLGAIGMVLVAGGAIAAWCVFVNQNRRAAMVFASCAALWIILISGVATARVSAHQEQDRLWAAIRARSSRPSLAAFACLEPSWVFYSGVKIDELSHGAIGPTHAPWIHDGGRWKPKDRIEVADFLAKHREPYILTTNEKLQELKGLLPPDFETVASAPFFLKDEQLVVLGRKPIATAAQDRPESRR